jgi:hypothetical protein
MRQSEIFQSKSFYPNKESHFVVDQRQLAKKESVTMRLNNYMLFTETINRQYLGPDLRLGNIVIKSVIIDSYHSLSVFKSFTQ